MGSERTKGQLIDVSLVKKMDPDVFSEFIKIKPTKMKRIEGPFTVVTREGTFVCDDGWLAIDAGGWPYAISAEEHARVYRAVESVR